MSSIATSLTDTLGRPLRDLRISVTDRCNFRCSYCMPKHIFNADHKFLPRSELLTLEEIVRLARLFVSQGVKKIRLTGGEPLIRRNIEFLVEQLASLPGLEDLSMTTNASLLSREKARALKDAGLQRLTVSLDALDDKTFSAINDVNFPVSQVLDGIDNAEAAGLMPIKVNMVVKHSVNGDSILPMAKHFHGSGHVLRFIEYMDVGNSNGWCHDEVIPSSEVVEMINAELPLEAVVSSYHGEVANRWRYKDGGGEIGVIASVTQPFCSSCTRLRLSARGQLYTCLFAAQGHDMRRFVRDGASDDDLIKTVTSIWLQREDRYSEIRTEHTVTMPKVEMSYIGG